MKNLVELATEMFKKLGIWHAPEFPFHAGVMPGHPRVLVIAGANCTGKSLTLDVFQAFLKKYHKASSAMTLSMRQRENYGSSFIFPTEQGHSSGANCVSLMSSAFHNANTWASEGRKLLLALDEPERGLSPGYARALGEYLGTEALKLHENMFGLLVIAHDRALLRGLAEALGTPPTMIFMQDKVDGLGEPGTTLPATAWDTWLDGTNEYRTIAELEQLYEKGHQTYQVIRQLMSRKKK